MTAFRGKIVELFCGFNPFCNNSQTKIAGHGNDDFNQCNFMANWADIVDEGSVDFKCM